MPEKLAGFAAEVWGRRLGTIRLSSRGRWTQGWTDIVVNPASLVAGTACEQFLSTVSSFERG